MEYFDYIVWLLPLLFVVHDGEELVGMGRWLGNNADLLKAKAPKFYESYKNYSVKGMLVAVLEELVLCLAVCVAVAFSGSEISILLWWGTFSAYAIHLIVHIAQCVFLRKYVPCVLTSVICLPISVLLLYQSAVAFDFDVCRMIVSAIIGIAIVAVNLWFALWLMRKVN